MLRSALNRYGYRNDIHDETAVAKRIMTAAQKNVVSIRHLSIRHHVRTTGCIPSPPRRESCSRVRSAVKREEALRVCFGQRLCKLCRIAARLPVQAHALLHAYGLEPLHYAVSARWRCGGEIIAGLR